MHIMVKMSNQMKMKAYKKVILDHKEYHQVIHNSTSSTSSTRLTSQNKPFQ